MFSTSTINSNTGRKKPDRPLRRMGFAQGLPVCNLQVHLLVGCVTLATEDWFMGAPQEVVSRGVPGGSTSAVMGLGGNAALAAEATKNGGVRWLSWRTNEFRTISTGRKPTDGARDCRLT